MSLMRPEGRPDPAAIAAMLVKRLPGYMPEWTPVAGSRGYALIQVFARYLALLDVGAQGLAQRNLLAFLDSLGVHLQPAQAARVPVVFSLVPNCPVDITVSAESQLAAQPAPPPASAQSAANGLTAPALLFFTEHTVTLARARLAALYSIDPGRDEYADHSSSLASGFIVFDEMKRAEHAIYLGHDTLFKLGGQGITLLVQCTLDAAPQKPLDIHWQYLSEVGWVTLQLVEEEDTTRGLTRDGQIALRLERGPDARRETFAGRSSYWLRGSLKTPVIRGENLRHNPLTINDLRVRVKFQKTGLSPEAAFADAISLDVSKDFYPFGQRPATYDSFYLASNEVFQRAGARVHLEVTMRAKGVPNALSLTWEYFGSRGWQVLGMEPPTFNFDVEPADPAKPLPEVVTFNCPADWQEAEVNGTRNRWLRVRITAGNYGDPFAMTTSTTAASTTTSSTSEASTTTASSTMASTTTASTTEPSTTTASTTEASTSEASTSEASTTTASTTVASPTAMSTTVSFQAVPPVIRSLRLSYSYLTDPAPLQHCVNSNDFQFADQSDAALWPDRSFDPFQPVSDLVPALHFGFDQPLPSGLVSLFVQVPGAEELEPGASSSFVWEYLSRNGWQQLGVRDETVGLRQSGMLQFIGAPDAIAAPGLGGKLYRLRARLTDGARADPRQVTGIWLNAAWASHRLRIERELLGTGDGTLRQALRYSRTPVLAGETVEIREWTGVGEGWRLVTADLAESDYRFERDRVDGNITAVWVRWREQANLYAAGPGQRGFVLERATGLIRFGDGDHGMVPPAGCAIVSDYVSGGGSVGNVGLGTLTQLRSALPLVATVTNPVAAAGGADSELLDDVQLRGPQQLRHGDRAISAADIEWIARDASPEVARARCLAITGPVGHAQRGWITVIVVPRSADGQPSPTAELQRRVANYLRSRVPATVTRRLQVTEPSYVAVSVAAEIVPLAPDQAAVVEAGVRRRLNDFLHPLTGGAAGTGWEFGASLRLSNIAAVIEATHGVDYARSIQLFVDGAEVCQTVKVARDALVCAGAHELKLTVGGR